MIEVDGSKQLAAQEVERVGHALVWPQLPWHSVTRILREIQIIVEGSFAPHPTSFSYSSKF